MFLSILSHTFCVRSKLRVYLFYSREILSLLNPSLQSRDKVARNAGDSTLRTANYHPGARCLADRTSRDRMGEGTGKHIYGISVCDISGFKGSHPHVSGQHSGCIGCSGFLKAHPGPPLSTPQRHNLSPHRLPSLKTFLRWCPRLSSAVLFLCAANLLLLLLFFYFTEPTKMHARSIARFHRARQHRAVKWLTRIKRRSEQVSAQKKVVELPLLSNRDYNR